MSNITLAARWHQLTTPLLVDEAQRAAMFHQLRDAYSASDRHYHTLHHVRALLDTVERATATLHDPIAVQLAVWFHDAVYSYRRSDNEERSAVLALDFLQKTTLSTERRQRVAYLIERTKDHTQAPPTPDTDLFLFLDADLQILGAPEADYWQYARQIRQEYRLIPDLLYRPGRRKVLEKMLAVPTLYRTALFQKLEIAARRNLRLELARL